MLSQPVVVALQERVDSLQGKKYCDTEQNKKQSAATAAE